MYVLSAIMRWGWCPILIQQFQDSVGELRRVARTGIEPPSVKFAKAIPAVKPPTPEPTE